MEYTGISLSGTCFSWVILKQSIKQSQKKLGKSTKKSEIKLAFDILKKSAIERDSSEFLALLYRTIHFEPKSPKSSDPIIYIDFEPSPNLNSLIFDHLHRFVMIFHHDHLKIYHHEDQIHLSLIDFDLKQIFSESDQQSNDLFLSFECLYLLLQNQGNAFCEIKTILKEKQKKTTDHLKKVAKQVALEIGNLILEYDQNASSQIQRPSVAQSIKNSKLSLKDFHSSIMKITLKLIFILQAQAKQCLSNLEEAIDQSLHQIKNDLKLQTTDDQTDDLYQKIIQILSPIQAIDQSFVATESLGQIYESLLCSSPKLFLNHQNQLRLTFSDGLDRKQTGTYFTPNHLVEALVDQALMPKIQEIIEQKISSQQKIDALLSLKICDPASGSGNLLIAVARKLTHQIIKLKQSIKALSMSDRLEILQQTIQSCLYAVDMQENAIELCQLSMWLEGRLVHQAFDFLKHQMKCGHALIGQIRTNDQNWTQICEIDPKQTFDWAQAFPSIFSRENSGFDVIVANPPWERLQFVEDSSLSLNQDIINPLALHQVALITHAKQLKYFRLNPAFKKTSMGDLNLYALFAERALSLLNESGIYSLIVPTGIATDHGNQHFFSDLIQSQKLKSLFDFENRKKLFSDVDSRFKFSILTVSCRSNLKMKFAFFLNQIEEMQNLDRSFELTAQDFLKLNPNTQTCPIFRYRQDAEITQKIYQKNIILINDHQCTETFSVRKSNPWKVSFRQGFFNMTLHKKYFETQNQPSHLALYEAKMMHLYDHRFASYEPQNQSFEYLSPKQQQDPDFRANPRYWVNAQYLPKKLKDQWFIVFRNIVRVTDKRTAIFSIIPKSAVSNSCGLLFLKQKPSFKMIFASICASLPFDYIVRQKIGGTNFNFHYLKQMPMLSPKLFSPKIKHALSQSFPNQSILALIIPKILELYYTANDLSCLCEDLFLDLLEIDPSLIQACHAQWRENQGLAIDDHSNTSTQNHLSTLPPFKWDDLRRAHLKAQLDVIYAKLYQFDFSDLCFILDPINGMLSDHDVHIEAFRVLKNEEIKIYQTFRTKDLIFYYWQKYFGNA